MAKDLTKGNLFKGLLALSLPTMIGFSAQSIYDLVDMFWIGKISAEAIAGVTVLSTVFWTVEALNEIIGASSISLISQNFGRKDIKRTHRAIEQTITFKAFVAIIAAVFLAIFLKPALGLFSKDKAVLDAALDYGYIRIFFLPITFSSFSVNTALRCTGDARTPMIIMVLSSILNILLDPILMFDKIPFINIPGFGLGVFGAALATVITQTIAFLAGFYVIFSGKHGIKPSLKGLLRLDKDIDKKLMTIGLPNGIEALLRSLSGVVVMVFVSMFGTAALATAGISFRILNFAFIPLIGISMGGSTLVGQNLGAKFKTRAIKATKIAAAFGFSLMIAFYIFLLFFSASVIRVFTADPEVIDLGRKLLIIGTAGMPLIGLSFGLSSGFSGAGYNFPFLIGSIVSNWVVQIPFLFLAINVLHLGINWVWVSFVTAQVSQALVMLVFYLQGKWVNREVR
ncbi:MATE family efflux transporter [Kosmotoga pacifica]|uniref:Multidrug-efflux transporter n=1 Tax=Kosmotoga pacifica TaxID=1330330 RepID=A0A0G2ZGW9_9BACT|nr:MATE family efflux transporter [Kosmotoga pacifica]AKI97998.1 multidrug transporter MATE [Kosmotoga pacifica]